MWINSSCHAYDKLFQSEHDIILLVNGAWSGWTGWSSCSITCGDSGTKSRTRSCSNPSPENNGVDCTGAATEEENCRNECPIDGSWCSWIQWGYCPVTCGGDEGLITRSRSCDCPPPQFGGSDCHGEATEEHYCADLPQCPGTH